MNLHTKQNKTEQNKANVCLQPEERWASWPKLESNGCSPQNVSVRTENCYESIPSLCIFKEIECLHVHSLLLICKT